MILAQRRAGVVGATLRAAAAFVVLGIVWHGSAVAVERPSRKTTPQRTLRSTTNPPPLPVDASPLRMRVETSEGVLVVFDAATMADDPPTCSGYLAYWQPVGLEGVYVYGQVLEHPGDVAAALRALEYALDVDLELLADSDDRVSAALAREPEVDEPTSSWGPVTTLGALEIMGFDAEDEFTRVDEPYDGGVAALCQPCFMAAGLGPPGDCGSPDGLAREALNVAAGCCGRGVRAGVGRPRLRLPVVAFGRRATRRDGAEGLHRGEAIGVRGTSGSGRARRFGGGRASRDRRSRRGRAHRGHPPPRRHRAKRPRARATSRPLGGRVVPAPGFGRVARVALNGSPDHFDQGYLAPHHVERHGPHGTVQTWVVQGYS